MKLLSPLTLRRAAGSSATAGACASSFPGTRPVYRTANHGFTLIEALVSLAILAIFGLASTAALNLFDDRAAHNRNAEAARAVIDDYVNYLLNDNTPAPAVTAAGTDLDGDGVPDGVVCTAINGRLIPPNTGLPGVVPGTIPLIVTRTATPVSVVNGTLYWRVQAVGTTYGLTSNTDLMQVNFLLVYVYRTQTYYYKVVTFKAST